ncbi:MAG TPA: NFACT RNA binding domain-containing protein [Candidatus Cybelea sp.]|jgi:predicted ribosome quality control (RQC) complex YloA/Tae2 family protein|nr:NFACT RNA binding domain-containing protein [Candidatus Cybelea sp.]
MRTDWVLIARLARELDERLRGARVQDAGLLPDGRVALMFRRGGAPVAMAIDLFSTPPAVTLEENELGVMEEPGFVRALARTLAGMILTAVSSRRFDRLLRLRFATRSRFGVGDEVELFIELVPRFGNLVLVKGDVVVAAYKEFTPAQNARRAVIAGTPYALPPLPEHPFEVAPAPADANINEPLYVYRRNDALVQASLLPLDGFEDAALAREPSLLAVLGELRRQEARRAGGELSARRRDALLRRLGEREAGLLRELESLAAKRRAAGERESLRAEGEGIFATLHELPEAERDEAKERAAQLFARYKKLRNALPHVTQREGAVRGVLEAVETLRWEGERAADEDLADVETAVDELTPQRRPRRTAAAPRRRRRMLEVRTGGGSRILVGRSPVENADLTFRLAKPDDLWFHARGVPGAHVILSRDGREQVPEEDVTAAASLAAYYSKARGSVSAAVDYTLRKHVRKQRAAPPGLVWYTHAKTIVARPQEVDSLGQEQAE